MKMFNFRTKVRVAGAVLVVCMFLVAGISGVFANTVTITDLAISDNSGLLINFTEDSGQFTRVSIGGVNFTDNGISDNTYGERINFTDDWFNFTNGFFGGVRKINSSYDNKDTFICNSNGNYWEIDGTADEVQIQAAIYDLNNESGTVTIPTSGATINTRLYTTDNLILDFKGKITLDDLGVEQVSMIQCDDENVLFINPQLDMDRSNNEVNVAVGMQITIYFTGSSNNCNIFGGNIVNSCQSGIGGCTHNLTVIGTEIDDAGEHGVYFNTYASDIVLDKINVVHPGDIGGHRGYGLKIGKGRSISMRDCYVEYYGNETWGGDNRVGFVVGTGSTNIKVHGRVVNAEYGIVISGKDGGQPNENIDISLVCINCTNFNDDTTPSDLRNCYVHDSYMNGTGHFRVNGFGEDALIERVRLNGSIVYMYTSTTPNVSFTVKNCHITTQGGDYPIRIQVGHDLVFEGNVIENGGSGTAYACINLQDVYGTITLRDNIFYGCNNWNVRFNSDPSEFICHGNRFKEHYNGSVASTSILFVKNATRMYIFGNINQSDYLPLPTTAPSAPSATTPYIYFPFATGNQTIAVDYGYSTYYYVHT